MTKKIKPCPFCGRQPSGPKNTGGDDERCGYNLTVSIVCKCGASIRRPSNKDKNGWCNDKGEAKAAVIEAWNTRKEPTP